MWRLGLLSLILLTGCVHRPVKTPALAERHCPPNSVPVNIMYHGVAYTHGEACQAVDPVKHQLIPGRVWWKADFSLCNPVLDQDCDESERDEAKPRKASWWVFWKSRNHADHPDKD